MSLLLTGAKTITIAGTEMSCIEIYTGESYTLPFAFVNSAGVPIDISSWTLSVAAKWYTCMVEYAGEEVIISDLILDAPQPSTPAGLATGKTSGGTGGLGYIFLPTTLSGGAGSPNPSPTPTVNDVTSILCIVTLTVSRTDPISGSTDTNREPIGIIIRYQ
jgi:hypothetical protein